MVRKGARWSGGPEGGQVVRKGARWSGRGTDVPEGVPVFRKGPGDYVQYIYVS